MTTKPDPNWFEDGLESVPVCPLCGFPERTLLHKNVADYFFGAPGHWTYWTCDRCDSAWLDPRPNEEKIGNAYTNYYTHEEPAAPLRNSYGFRRKLRNGFRNWRFGSRAEPSHPLGKWVGRFSQSIREENEHFFRFLPRKHPADTPRVLDYGCGNGNFLRAAREIGWKGFGVEPDPNSRRIAASLGFPVVETLADISPRNRKFDAVTLSHVIEHVHRPHDVMRSIAKFMNSGAFLYIATPNIDAVGHRIYGRNWRGLEPPRHLILFNHESMNRLLSHSGFTDIRYHCAGDPMPMISAESRKAASEDGSPHAPIPSAQDRKISNGPGEQAEYLVLTARRTIEPQR